MNPHNPETPSRDAFTAQLDRSSAGKAVTAVSDDSGRNEVSDA